MMKILCGLLCALPLFAQDFTFEVASIKVSAARDNSTSIYTSAGRFRTENTSLHHLIQVALGAQEYQLIGGPAWIRDARYDINAKDEAAEYADIPQSDRKSLEARNARTRARLLNLLKERFQLTLREEKKELPIFALTVDKAKLKATEAKGNMSVNGRNGGGTISGEGITIESLCTTLGNILERPVVDETGLEGFYDVEIKYSQDTSTLGNEAPSADASGPSLVTAVREQLGLRLNGKKGPVTTWVIEKVEKPTEN